MAAVQWRAYLDLLEVGERSLRRLATLRGLLYVARKLGVHLYGGQSEGRGERRDTKGARRTSRRAPASTSSAETFSRRLCTSARLAAVAAYIPQSVLGRFGAARTPPRREVTRGRERKNRDN